MLLKLMNYSNIDTAFAYSLPENTSYHGKIKKMGKIFENQKLPFKFAKSLRN